jgi:malectin (di-glucose binding ER protein)
VSGVVNPAPLAVYQSARVGNFTYTIKGFTPGAPATVRLHFAETFFTTVGSRVFNVKVNGASVLTGFDIVKVTGGRNIATAVSSTIAASSAGAYVIQLSATTNQSLLSGIEISTSSSNGAACTSSATCASGNCVDGVCCASASCGSCQSCALAGAQGTCTLVPFGAIDPRGVCVDHGPATCGTNGTCDGSGGCALYPNGVVCRPASCPVGAGSATSASFCSAGVCIAGAQMSCAPFLCGTASSCATSCQNDAGCTAGFHCVGGLCGARSSNGATCTTAAQCLSGDCVDGVCCASASCGSCQSCAVAGAQGICAPVPSGAPDPHGVCVDHGATSCGTNGKCDGAGGCAVYANGVICAAASCPPGASTLMQPGVCSAGVCVAGPQQSCAPYLCGATNACLATCVDASQCSVGHSCAGGVCQ